MGLTRIVALELLEEVLLRLLRLKRPLLNTLFPSPLLAFFTVVLFAFDDCILNPTLPLGLFLLFQVAVMKCSFDIGLLLVNLVGVGGAVHE